MQPQRIIAEPVTYPNIPMIDRGFDGFELNNDLESNLHEAEVTTFYHDASNLEE